MTELPEGLEDTTPSIDRDGYRIFVYTEPVPDEDDFGGFAMEPANAEFLIRNGEVEITTYGSPRVPVDVLHFIAVQTDRLRGGTDADSTG